MDVQVDAQVDVRAELDVKDLDSSIQEKNVWEEEGSVLKLINMLGSLEGLPSLSLQ